MRHHHDGALTAGQIDLQVIQYLLERYYRGHVSRAVDGFTVYIMKIHRCKTTVVKYLGKYAGRRVSYNRS